LRFHHLLAALVLTTLAAAPAAAQTPAVPVVEAGTPLPVVEAGTWSATPFLSFTFARKPGNESCCSGSGLGLGAAAEYDFTDRIGVEGEIGYVFDLIGDSPDDWSSLNVGAGILYHFPLDNGLAPYGAFGIGFVRSARTIADVRETSTEFGANLGGGIKVPLTDAFSARGDLRYFKGNDLAFDGWRLYGGITWKIKTPY
jgi:opacity protein-like surface antigen